MRLCTFDSAFGCLTREKTKISQVPSTIIGISRELHLNLLAVVLMRGDEARVGGDEIDADESTMARSVISFLLTCA